VQGRPAPQQGQQGHQSQQEQGGDVARPPRSVTFDDSDDLDVPDFLK
jgi:cell division protein FtsZ